MSEKEILWDQFISDRSSENMFALVEFYQPFLREVASSVAYGLPNHIDLDDLVSEGQFGLISAIERYEDRGYKFETYASLRIRGQIIDKLRVADWAPRSLRTSLKSIEETETLLTSVLQRKPSDEEVAFHLGISLEKYHEIRGRGSIALIGHLDEVTTVEQKIVRLSDMVADSSSDFSFEEFEPIRLRLAEVLSQLEFVESSLLILYYVYCLSLKEIGRELEVTESRVCQLHVKALTSIREACLNI